MDVADPNHRQRAVWRVTDLLGGQFLSEKCVLCTILVFWIDRGVWVDYNKGVLARGGPVWRDPATESQVNSKLSVRGRMFQFDHATAVTLCFFGFLILAPLSVCGIFALSEYYQEYRMRRRCHSRRLRLVSRR